jgi:succinate dehydrogenase / fumarate reductase membrane anchor subunit
MANKSMRSDLGRVRGLGSAKEGVNHWWMQRLTAIALIPLTLWFVISIASLSGSNYSTTIAWLSSPLVAVFMILLVAATLYHALLGVQVVIFSVRRSRYFFTSKNSIIRAQ